MRHAGPRKRRLILPYLCFDIGSSALKAALISEEGRLLSQARRPVQLLHGEEGAHEADAKAWVEAAFSAGAEAIAAARLGASARGGRAELEVRALAVSGNGPTLLATDASGLPLGPALSYLDRRASREAEEVSALAGMTIDPTFYLPKALHLWRQADEAKRKKIRWFFACPEYLVYALCGEAITCLPHPGYEPYIWNSSMIASLGMPADRFPPFAAPATTAGALLPEAAARLGLPSGVPVIVGFPDFIAAIVGSAAVKPGLACDRAGTSEALNLCATRPFPRRDLLSLPLPINGLWNVSGGVSTAGAALDWLERSFRRDPEARGGIDIAGLIVEASQSAPGARGLVFLPYLAGERAPLWDSSRRAAFVGLSIEHDRKDLARAVCESLAFGLKLAADLALGEGMRFELLRVSGHAATDDFLCGLKAQVLGVPVEVPEVLDCELLGDAAACAAALGDASDLGEAATARLRIKRRFEPGPDFEAYASAYSHFTEALRALESVDRSIGHKKRTAEEESL